MEDILTQLMNDASSPKYAAVRKSCQTAIDLLSDANIVSDMPAYDLREKCLEPFQLALETKAKKLAAYAVSGIQQIMKDDRFQSSIESEKEEKWLPIQILNTVFSTPTLPEDTQVEIMKLLLNMTFSTAWCMNAKVITKVTQVYIDTYTASSHSVRGAVKAALTQLLSSFVEKLNKVEDEVVADGSDILADFKAKGNSSKTSMTNDMVAILKFFTEKLEQASVISAGQGRLSVPLLLEGVYTIVSSCPIFIRDNKVFQEILWQHLCPTLISLLGTPKSERSATLQKQLSREEIGRGSGCSLTAPNLQLSTAKTIYNIAVSLVQLMGPVGSLRPMLESLFHRMLLYPPPQHRLDALKAIKELLKSVDSLCNLAVPPSDIDYSEKIVHKNPNSDISLLKLMIDSIQESCHCNDSAVCITSVMCIDEMLGALEHISKGFGINEVICDNVNKYYRFIDKGSSHSEVSSDYDGGAGDLNGSFSSVGSHGTEVKDAKEVSEENSTNEITQKLDDLNVEPIENCDNKNVLDPNAGFMLHRQEQIKQQSIIREELKKRFNKLGSEYEAVERQNARELISELSRVLPQMGHLMSVTEVDEALQQFASNFCIALYKNQSSVSQEQACHMAILNADGVYVTTITALLLNLKLSVSGYYNTHDESSLQMTEKEFLDDILSSGLLLFLSPAWLSEIYEQVISNNLLQQTGCLGSTDIVILQLLKDIDGLNSHQKGGQLMSHTSMFEDETNDTNTEVVENEAFVESGKKLAKRILSKCWDGVLDVLSVLLNGKSSCGISSSLALMLGTEGAKEESIRAREAIVMSLDGLQKAARLCCTLGLQQRCGSVFSQLASTSCVLFDSQKSPTPDRKSIHKSVSSTKINKPVRLHAAHLLSMDVVMTTGLEMGSHSEDCWKHVFRCSAFISELEHTYFSQGNNQSSLPKLQQEQTKDIQDEDGCDPELYSVPVTAAVPVAPRINIPNLIKQSSIESGWDRSLTGGGVLNSAQASQALCGLSQEVDRLFEDAAEKLNLCALLSFLSELSEAGRIQLIKVTKHKEEDDFLVESQQLPPNALHLYRLQEVLMKIVHSDRPYIHMMRGWSAVSSFLVEAAGHHDRSVSKMAVTCVHDFILAMLSNHPELPHFHVNELLCKTFENMLCLELCDGDVQDQIVCSICELVEACTADIRSGWRPLFGALRAVKIEYTTNEEVNEARQRHIAAVLDVFEVYLNTDNILVFANAAVDCILCLLKYVRGPGEFEDLSDDDDSDSGSDFDVSVPSGENLCVPALGYLKQCSKILQRMWTMPACPVFNGAHRIHTDSDQHFVDTSIPHMDMDEFIKVFTEKSADSSKGAGDSLQAEVIAMATKTKINQAVQRSLDEEDRIYDSSSITSTDSGISSIEKSNKSKVQSLQVKVKCDLNLETMDNHSGILHVWFLLLDGLASSVSSCPRNYQPDTLEMLFELLGSVVKVPGPKFALYCVNHLLLPMLQTWLRTGARKQGYWDTGATNFKQCCGLCTDLIVDFIHEFSSTTGDIIPMVELMLKQVLDVLIECISQPVEVISRLGCSCIRHIFLSAGRSFTEEMWQIGSEAMQKALDTSTFYIQQLMMLFQANSENFYGDIGQVKVAMRQDSTPMESQRLKHLAHQVFLLDSQISTNGPVCPDIEEDKSFVFLLYTPGCENSLNPDDIITRIPFRSIVVGLLSNQLLVQTVGSVLLSKENMDSSACEQSQQNEENNDNQSTSMPGMLSMLSTRNLLTFLKCLRSSYKLAGEFDSRPGLKFLIQKVARTEVAVNLYKQAGASMIFYIHTLIQVGANINGLLRKDIREILSGIHQKEIDIYSLGAESTANKDKIHSSPKTFLQLLTCVCDELCQTYVDILNDDNIVDQMAEQQVFFLIAQPDDISDFVRKKTEQPPLDNQSNTLDVVQPGVFITTEAVSTQEHHVQDSSDDNEEEDIDDKKSQISDPDTCKSQPHGKSKRELREEQESKVYTLATDTLIKTLMTEYKKRKQHHAMPSFVKIGKQKKSTPPPSKKTDVDAVIEKQQKSSTMKDSEARKQSWTELLCTILELFQQLPDHKFDSLMPTIFYCVNQLVCHADDRRLKDALGQWLHRVGVMMELTPS